MKVCVMREADSKKVASLLALARENIGRPDTLPAMLYLMLPDYKPTFIYNYYNLRSRHFRLEEVFFTALDEEQQTIQGVLSFAEFTRKKAFLKVFAVDQPLANGGAGADAGWFLDAAIAELRRFRDLEAVRLLVARKVESETEQFVGPHIDAALAGRLATHAFSKLARLEREGGRNVAVEIYERAVAAG